jgi:hypothetical protein
MQFNFLMIFILIVIITSIFICNITFAFKLDIIVFKWPTWKEKKSSCTTSSVTFIYIVFTSSQSCSTKFLNGITYVITIYSKKKCLYDIV